MGELAKRHCEPSAIDSLPLSEEVVITLYRQLQEGWLIEENHHLEKIYHFTTFAMALSFVNTIGMIAESQKHHPDIYLTWGKVMVTLFTHKMDGLSENDFILADKIDEAYVKDFGGSDGEEKTQ